MQDSADPIRTAIDALEAQRAALGDAIAEMALAPLRARLEEAQARAGADEQRLKLVTVLFLDMVGSTELSRQLDPEDVHVVLDGALERLTGVVDAAGGRVLQYAGDSLLAVFGALEAHEDDPERAVRAGLALIGEAPRVAAAIESRHGIAGFDVRVGINTGTVLLGGGVDAEGSIRGVAVNIAARMEQTAPRGGLRISHDTYRHVRGMFDVEAQDPILVKGISEPIRSYLVLAARPRRFRVANRGIEGLETRMVGREAELARLIDTFEGACEDRSLALVTVVGDAGMGKSRLGFEFGHWLELRRESVRFFQGRARPNGSNVPYGLLRDLLAWRFGILDGDSQAVAQTKLAEGLAPVLGDRAAEQTALIGQLVGLDYARDPHIAAIVGEARQIRDRSFHALAGYFRRLHAQDGQPIAVLLDDLQWADEGSLDFVNHLAHSCRELPMLVLGMTRGTLFERRPLWGGGQRQHERIDLVPLSRRSSRELVDVLLARLDVVPAALRDLLTTSAEGNPYFVEELIGMLVDDGVIVTGPERWTVVGDKLLDVQVPPTLAGVLQARVDALPPTEKAALQLASVIGHVFWDEALQVLAPGASAALDALARRELVHARETSAFDGAREFVFRHHLLHQVTYDGVLKRDRRRDHGLIADWLVQRSGDRASEYFGLIADHFERAGDAPNAITYLRRAGEDAARAHANDAALEFLGRALKHAPADDHATRHALLLTRRHVLSNAGRRDEQGADVGEIERLADLLDDDELRARAGGLRTAHALVTADYDGACRHAARAVAWAEAAGVGSAALQARTNWARALQFKGEYREAQQMTEQALGFAREAGERRIEGTMLLQLGILAFQRGDYSGARAHYQQALEMARALGDRSVESSAINNLGETERLLGNYAAAFGLFESGRRVSREIAHRMTDAYLLANMAHTAFLQGDPEASLRWSEQAEAVGRQLHDPDLMASLLGTRGHAHAALGRHDAAADCYRQSLATYHRIGRPTMPPEPIAGLARLALARDSVVEAMHLITDVVRHFDAGGTVDGTEDPLWIYLTCYDVLRAAASSRAIDFLERGHVLLMQRAGLLAAAERDSFLGQVPSHRAVVAAWAELSPVQATD